ncbi:type IX secretion system membrane protein PorP/SprF [Flagellimonas lutimaris]|uniref:Type IX secretion system membrane protein PorP/SprF n=1 Tax=Flagellimonas lutimaris TaxID=475082 RepID=A0A3A1NF26_9FLAO|nr:PorP/SprF family type IX secretion system membrane protein [Allomuricauda lutimaris]RIV37701.1 type IX secretion system membrane protein PorP/SprF [Allomuricauda lutimaris]
MNIRRHLSILLCSISIISLKGQQNPAFTEYSYNPFIINSAYAGMSGNAEINFSNIGLKDQSIEGLPRTMTTTFSTPHPSGNMGFGAGVIHDRIGVSTSTEIFGAYSYKIILNDNIHPYWKIYDRSFISLGLKAGAMIYNEDFLSLGIPNDPKFAKNLNSTIPQIGIGALFGYANFFAGFSMPNIIGDNFSNPDKLKISRPFYGYLGYHFILNKYDPDYILKPSLLFKFESGAPFQIDINLSLRVKNQFEFGAGLRTKNSVNAIAGFYISKNLRALYSYTHGAANSPLGSTHGLILGYRFGDNGFYH